MNLSHPSPRAAFETHTSGRASALWTLNHARSLKPTLLFPVLNYTPVKQPLISTLVLLSSFDLSFLISHSWLCFFALCATAAAVDSPETAVVFVYFLTIELDTPFQCPIPILSIPVSDSVLCPPACRRLPLLRHQCPCLRMWHKVTWAQVSDRKLVALYWSQAEKLTIRLEARDFSNVRSWNFNQN